MRTATKSTLSSIHCLPAASDGEPEISGFGEARDPSISLAVDAHTRGGIVSSAADPGNVDEVVRVLLQADHVAIHLIVAREVMKCARRDGVSMLPEEKWIEWEEWGDPALEKYIKAHIYDPVL